MKLTSCLLGCGAILAASPAHALVFTTSATLPLTIPDGSGVGAIPAPGIVVSGLSGVVSDINISFEIGAPAGSLDGILNGDFYAYLRYDPDGLGGAPALLSILLNRSGKTVADPDVTVSTTFTQEFGYSDNGFNITLDDEAAGDVHTYRSLFTPGAGDPLTGIWQPDGRAFDPSLVTDLSPRTKPLSVFDGVNPNGTWEFFIADLAQDGVSAVLESLSIDITTRPSDPGPGPDPGVPPVPEGTAGVWLAAVSAGAFALRRFRKA